MTPEEISILVGRLRQQASHYGRLQDAHISAEETKNIAHLAEQAACGLLLLLRIAASPNNTTGYGETPDQQQITLATAAMRRILASPVERKMMTPWLVEQWEKKLAAHS